MFNMPPIFKLRYSIFFILALSLDLLKIIFRLRFNVKIENLFLSFKISDSSAYNFTMILEFFIGLIMCRATIARGNCKPPTISSPYCSNPILTWTENGKNHAWGLSPGLGNFVSHRNLSCLFLSKKLHYTFCTTNCSAFP